MRDGLTCECAAERSDLDVVAVRRDLHAHPELAFAESRTTALIVEQLRVVGLAPTVLPSGTGVVCDIGRTVRSSRCGPTSTRCRWPTEGRPLPVDGRRRVPRLRSRRAHRDPARRGARTGGRDRPRAGAADLPAGRGDRARRRARRDRGGGLDGVEQIFALHCDPRLDTGEVGVRVGAITAACDQVEVRLSGPGGHTARPHLTPDLVYALGRLITELPGLLSRRVDPRAALSLVWGAVEAGRAANAIPTSGALRGTLRVFDRDAWDAAGPLVRDLVDEIVAPSGCGRDDYTAACRRW